MKQNQGQVSWMLVAVASFAVIAVWQLAVRPLDQKLHAKRAGFQSALAELDHGSREMKAATIDPRVLLQGMQETAADFESVFGELAAEPNVYNRFDPLARRAGITIKRLEPSHRDAAFKEGAAEVATAGFVVECEGTLDAAAEFLRLIQRENGLSHIVSVRIVPIRTQTGAQELVHLSLKTEHVMITGLFDLAESHQ